MEKIVIKEHTGLAIASLILSIADIFGYGLHSILDVIFGHIANLS